MPTKQKLLFAILGGVLIVALAYAVFQYTHTGNPRPNLPAAWLEGYEKEPVRPQAGATPLQVDLVMDTSVSMVGFLPGQSRNPSAFKAVWDSMGTWRNPSKGTNATVHLWDLQGRDLLGQTGHDFVGIPLRPSLFQSSDTPLDAPFDRLTRAMEQDRVQAESDKARSGKQAIEEVPRLFMLLTDGQISWRNKAPDHQVLARKLRAWIHEGRGLGLFIIKARFDGKYWGSYPAHDQALGDIHGDRLMLLFVLGSTPAILDEAMTEFAQQWTREGVDLPFALISFSPGSPSAWVVNGYGGSGENLTAFSPQDKAALVQPGQRVSSHYFQSSNSSPKSLSFNLQEVGKDPRFAFLGLRQHRQQQPQDTPNVDLVVEVSQRQGRESDHENWAWQPSWSASTTQGQVKWQDSSLRVGLAPISGLSPAPWTAHRVRLYWDLEKQLESNKALAWVREWSAPEDDSVDKIIDADKGRIKTLQLLDLLGEITRQKPDPAGFPIYPFYFFMNY